VHGAHRVALPGGSRQDHGMKIAITGASGFIGQALVPRLRTGGHDVVRFVRGSAGADDERGWDPSTRTLDPAHLADVDAVIHLAGAGVADKRWTDARKAVVLGSRVDGTTAVARAVAGVGAHPGAAVRQRGRATTATPGRPARTRPVRAARASWPRSAGSGRRPPPRRRRPGTRVAHLRTGIVLGRGGGALTPQLPVFKAGLGAPLGSGRQWVPWISLHDEVEAIVHLLDADVSGPVNLVAPSR
jgi:NAD dependent epimerase/dehydratase family enzyme